MLEIAITFLGICWGLFALTPMIWLIWNHGRKVTG